MSLHRFLTIAFALLACEGSRGLQRRQTNTGASPVVASVSGVTITLAKLDEYIKRQPSAMATARDAGALAATRRVLLDELIRTELFLVEARRLGYESHPDVVDAQQRNMVVKYLDDTVGSKIKAGEFQIYEYYETHIRDFSPVRELRGHRVILPDLATAEEVFAKARDIPVDALGRLVELFKKYSVTRGGGSTTGMFVFTPQTTTDQAVVRAALRLDIGKTAPPIKGDTGYHVLRITGKVFGVPSPFSQVKAVAESHLVREIRVQKMAALERDLRRLHSVKIDEERIYPRSGALD